MSYEQEMDKWKERHGLPKGKSDVSQDELRMAVEESLSTEECWCADCDKHMPVREMKLITRSIDPYVQIQERGSDYITDGNRVRMCPECFKDRYEESED